MSLTAADGADVVVTPQQRLDELCEELSVLAGQRNAIDGRIAAIAAELSRDGLWAMTGAKSLPAMLAWKLGLSEANTTTLAAIAARYDEFPRCTTALTTGALSLDQVGVIAKHAGTGSDEHYIDLALNATVRQLRKAISLEPPPPPPHNDQDDPDQEDPDEPGPEPPPNEAGLRGSISKTSDEQFAYYRITLPHAEAAVFDTALRAHHDALITDWKTHHRTGVPIPGHSAAFMRLITAGWDTEATARPQGQHTTVIVHLDLAQRLGALHLGPVLPEAERQYLTCDATCEVWFEHAGQPLGHGRTTRTVNRRLRRALEHRHHGTCAVPGCHTTQGLQAHHIRHWEDGGTTDLDNLILLCPYHHRAHHRGLITITGPATHLIVTDRKGRPLTNTTLARPPDPNTPPPNTPPYRGPTGEHAQWWWYDPYQPPPPTHN